MENVRIKDDALTKLKLPIQIKHGQIRKLDVRAFTHLSAGFDWLLYLVTSSMAEDYFMPSYNCSRGHWLAACTFVKRSLGSARHFLAGLPRCSHWKNDPNRDRRTDHRLITILLWLFPPKDSRQHKDKSIRHPCPNWACSNNFKAHRDQAKLFWHSTPHTGAKHDWLRGPLDFSRQRQHEQKYL